MTTEDRKPIWAPGFIRHEDGKEQCIHCQRMVSDDHANHGRWFAIDDGWEMRCGAFPTFAIWSTEDKP